MKFDKKIIIIIAAVVALAVIASVASLVACGNGNNPENGETESTINVPGESGNENESDEGNENTGELTFTDCAPADVYVLNKNGALNLRTAPNYTADSVKVSVPNGTKLSKIAVSNNGEWFKVEYNNEVLYVVSKYTTNFADLDAGFVACEKTLVKNDGSLTIRIEPAVSNNDVLGYYSAGDEITVVAENKDLGWYKVEFVDTDGNKIFGYIANDAKYFEGGEEESTTETTEAETEVETEASAVK
jgi:hypothetical protein